MQEFLKTFRSGSPILGIIFAKCSINTAGGSTGNIMLHLSRKKSSCFLTNTSLLKKSVIAGLVHARSPLSQLRAPSKDHSSIPIASYWCKG